MGEASRGNSVMNRHGVLLTVNAGSSSLRLAAFAAEPGLKPLASARDDAHDGVAGRVRTFLDRQAISSVACVAHRVVHGGTLTASCLIDAAVETEIERVAPLVPLHNPAALAGVRACRALLGSNVPQVAVFDTAYYAGLPAVARTYGLPRELVERHGLRRYGFHGIAHQALWRRWRTLRPDFADGGRVISLQLGAGCSITAIAGGTARDTSMGFTRSRACSWRRVPVTWTRACCFICSVRRRSVWTSWNGC